MMDKNNKEQHLEEQTFTIEDDAPQTKSRKNDDSHLDFRGHLFAERHN